jgi:hypothetical protein
MAKPFKTLKEKMSRQVRARAEQKTEELIAEMPRNEVRAARKVMKEKRGRT